MNEIKSLEECGEAFADGLTAVVRTSEVSSQLEDPKESFLSGCYFGAVQGYKRGVNQMLVEAVKYLPDIFNEIARTDFDMSINWQDRFRNLILEHTFGIKQE